MITVGGQNYVTTQLFFDYALTTEIVASQPIYEDRGARDTTNQNDGVISAAAVGDYLLSTQKMTDGAMLSWKTIVLRTSLSETLCTAPGGTMSGGPGGDGGFPGGGPGGDGGPPPGRGCSLRETSSPHPLLHADWRRGLRICLSPSPPCPSMSAWRRGSG